jgi:predicted  nucleic acid-binding Zn-ribbon protein
MAKKAIKTIEISVEEKLRALYDLQIIDSRLDEIRNTRGDLPVEVEYLEIEIEGIEKRAEKFRQEIKEQNDEIGVKKEAISHSKTLIDKYKAQQNKVRNNKEFEAFAKEMEYQDLEIQLAEKRIKESDAKIEHKKETLDELNAKIDEFRSHLKFKKEELEGLIGETQKEEDYLLEKSKEFGKKIDERLFASYNRIRSNSANGLAVVGLERGAPKGSFFTIPPQKQMEIAQRKKIIIDEHSGKILVDDELVTEENARMKKVIKF